MKNNQKKKKRYLSEFTVNVNKIIQVISYIENFTVLSSAQFLPPSNIIATLCNSLGWYITPILQVVTAKLTEGEQLVQGHRE